MSEHQEQSLLFQWAEHASGRYPELKLLYAIPNFSGRLGKVPPVAAIRQAQKLNREGRKRGVPDICLPVARHGFHACYIELKDKGGKLSPEQAQWLAKLSAAGNFATWAVGWEAAQRTLESYLAPSK